jgi:glycosyltransferase involved in cell wall biosynthesis
MMVQLDQSETIIKSYDDPRITYIKNSSNIKLISTLNKGIALAKGYYVARMDADDISLPDRLQIQLDFMEKHQDVTVCGTWFETIGEKASTTKYETTHQDIMYKMLYQCHIAHPTTIMRVDHIRTFETIFDPVFAHAEDYDLFTRVGHKYKLANIPEVLLRYRKHQNSVSAKYNTIQNQNSRIVRHREFEILGYDISPELLEDFCSLNYSLL